MRKIYYVVEKLSLGLPRKIFIESYGGEEAVPMRFLELGKAEEVAQVLNRVSHDIYTFDIMEEDLSKEIIG